MASASTAAHSISSGVTARWSPERGGASGPSFDSRDSSSIRYVHAPASRICSTPSWYNLAIHVHTELGQVVHARGHVAGHHQAIVPPHGAVRLQLRLQHRGTRIADGADGQR